MKACDLVNRLLDAVDPDGLDDPSMMLQSHPGFQFKLTDYMGYQVFVKGPGEDKSDWPEDIGRIVHTVTIPPGQRPENHWHVTDVRGIPSWRLHEFGLGVGVDPNLRTFDTPEDAAMAIWIVRSRMPEKKGVRGKKRRLPEAEDPDAPDLAHWGQRLSMEARLDKLYGPGRPYMKDPDMATWWGDWLRFGKFTVWSSFIIWYKAQNAPGANISYEINHAGWEHKDSELLHGRYNILNLIELLEQEVEKLKINPPQKATDVTRVFHKVLRFAYDLENGVRQ